MNPTEISIIYLSIGSAVGAHYFFKADRAIRQRRRVRTKVMAVVMVWPIHLIFNCVRRLSSRSLSNIFAGASQLDSHVNQEIFLAQKRLELILDSNDCGIDLYDWRDTLARYAGLSTATADPDASTRSELTGLSSTPAVPTQHICLNRRNRVRLLKHRNNARVEFLDSFVHLLKSAEDPKTIGRAALEFVKLLNDNEAFSEIDVLLEGLKQTRPSIPVENLENRTWIPQEQ